MHSAENTKYVVYQITTRKSARFQGFFVSSVTSKLFCIFCIPAIQALMHQTLIICLSAVFQFEEFFFAFKLSPCRCIFSLSLPQKHLNWCSGIEKGNWFFLPKIWVINALSVKCELAFLFEAVSLGKLPLSLFLLFGCML